jgi:hypothetical protein
MASSTPTREALRQPERPTRRTVQVQRRGPKAAPVELDLRTPSGRRLPW